MPSIGDARKFTSKFVTDPFLTLRFHSPVKITLNALDILKSESGTVITKELIWPVAEKLSRPSIFLGPDKTFVVFL